MPALERQQIVEEALRWIGTPYGYEGRGLGLTADCICLPLLVGKQVGLIPQGLEFKGYTEMPNPAVCVGSADTHLERKLALQSIAKGPPASLLPGDIGLFWYRERRVPQHFGIFTDYQGMTGVFGMVHAARVNGKVVHARVDQWWWKRLMYVYRYKGLAD